MFIFNNPSVLSPSECLLIEVLVKYLDFLTLYFQEALLLLWFVVETEMVEGAKPHCAIVFHFFFFSTFSFSTFSTGRFDACCRNAGWVITEGEAKGDYTDEPKKVMETIREATGWEETDV